MTQDLISPRRVGMGAFILALLVTALLALANPVQAQTGSISGTITDADGGAAIADIQVVAINTSTFDNFFACTDIAGTYSFTGLAVGNYAVYSGGPFADGNCTGGGGPPGSREGAAVTDYAQEYYDGAYTFENATKVAVTNGGTASNIDIALDVGASVSGTLLDDTNTVIPSSEDVAVIVAVEDDPQNPQNTGWNTFYVSACPNSDGPGADGSYTLTNLPVGYPFKVYASQGTGGCGFMASPTVDYATEWYNEVTNRIDATAITINTAGGSQTGVNFTLSEAGSVSGFVYDEDGSTPIQHMEVWAVNYSKDIFASACTAIDGSYTVDGITPGVDIKMYTGNEFFNNCNNFSGPTNYNETWYNQKPNEQTADVLTFTSGEAKTGINFTILPPSGISGTVTDAASTNAIQNIAVYANSTNFSWFGSTCTDASGNYTLTGMPQDTNIVVYVDGTLGCGLDFGYERQYYNGEFSQADATLIQTTAANPLVENIDFAMEDGGSITITAQDSGTNDPIPGVRVEVNLGFDLFRSACTDGSGQATFDGLPKGNTFNVNGGNSFNDSVPNVGPCSANYVTSDNVQQVVTVAAPDANVTLSLDPAGTIEGTVASGGDEANVTVYDATTFEYIAGKAVSGGGSYSIRGVPLDTGVVVGSTGYNFSPGFTQTKGAEYYSSTGDVATAADADTLTVTAGTTPLTGIDITLDTTAVTITGTVYASDGTSPLGSVPIAINGGDGFLKGCTGADGTYTISYAQDGTNYNVTAGGTSVSFCQDQSQPLVWYDAVATEGEATPVAGGSTGIDFVMAGDPPTAPTGLFTDLFTYTENPPVSPTYNWIGTSDATSYRLFVRRTPSNAVVVNQVYTAADICTDLDCNVTPTDLLPSWGLVDGDYQWWVAAINADNSVNWSGVDFAPATFFVNLPAALLPTVTVEERTGRPLVTWSDDPNTLWMQVWLGPAGDKTYTKWVQRDGDPEDNVPDFTCAEGTCSFDPEWDAPGGDYTAWLRAWGPGGYSSGGPLENAPQWAGDEFSLPTTQTDMSTLSPSFVGSDGTDLNFTWTGSEVATWYQIYITNDDGPPYTSFVQGQWITATELGCDGNPTAGTCEYTAVSVGPNLTVDEGYALWIRAYGPGGFGTGGLNGGVWLRTDFTYTVNP